MLEQPEDGADILRPLANTVACLLRMVKHKEERVQMPHAIIDSCFGLHTTRSFLMRLSQVSFFCCKQLNSSELTHSMAQRAEEPEYVVPL